MVLLHLSSDKRISGSLTSATFNVQELGLDLSPYKSYKLKLVGVIFTLASGVDDDSVRIDFEFGVNNDAGNNPNTFALTRTDSSSFPGACSIRKGPFSPFATLNMETDTTLNFWEILIQFD